MTDLYQDLGIDRTATPAEVKAAHRRKAKESHPDVPGGSKEEFGKVQRAYVVLSDAARREKYDKTGDGEAEPDIKEAHAREIVAKCMNAAIDASAHVAFNEDIFIGMREHTLKGAIRTIRQTIDSKRSQIAKKENFLAKVKRKKKGGQDLVKELIGGMIAELHRDIARAEEAITAHERAIEIVAEYEYEFEQQQQQVYLNGAGINASSGSWFRF